MRDPLDGGVRMSSRCRILGLTTTLLVLLASASYAEESNTFRDDVNELLELTNSAAIGLQFGSYFVSAFSDALKQANPALPPEAFAIVDAVVLRTMSQELEEDGGLMDQIAEIYMQHFTHADILEMNKFYRSPVGKKAINVMPQLLQESTERGEAWGQSLAPKLERQLLNELRSEGYEI